MNNHRGISECWRRYFSVSVLSISRDCPGASHGKQRLSRGWKLHVLFFQRTWKHFLSLSFFWDFLWDRTSARWAGSLAGRFQGGWLFWCFQLRSFPSWFMMRLGSPQLEQKGLNNLHFSHKRSKEQAWRWLLKRLEPPRKKPHCLHWDSRKGGSEESRKRTQK